MHTQTHGIMYIVCWMVNLKEGVLLCALKGIPSEMREIQFYLQYLLILTDPRELGRDFFSLHDPSVPFAV